MLIALFYKTYHSANIFQLKLVSHRLDVIPYKLLVDLDPSESLSEEPFRTVDARRLTRTGEMKRESLFQRP